MPTISAIVPVYNTEKTLSRCLDSILAQTFDDFEIIIVDDGSPDNAYAVAKHYAEHDSRIMILRQPNQGLGAARNAGLSHARGEFISFIDSDDYVNPKMFESMYTAISTNSADMAVCQVNNVSFTKNGSIKELGSYTIPCPKDCITGEEALHLQLNFIVPILFNSMCFKLTSRKLFEENDVLFPEQHRYAEDTPTSIGLFLFCEKIALIKEDLYTYVHDDGSLTSSYSVKKSYDILLDLIDIENYVLRSDAKIDLSNFYIGMLFPMQKQLEWAADSDEKKRAEVKEAIKSIRQRFRPNFSIKEIPLMQKTKILISYSGSTSIICALFKHLRWIPFVKYMM